MNGISGRPEAVRIYVSRWKVRLYAGFTVSLLTYALWATYVDRDTEPLGPVFVLAAIAVVIWFFAGIVVDPRPVVVLDGLGISRNEPGWWPKRLAVGRKTLRWEEIGEVRTHSFWGGFFGVVLIPKGAPSESAPAHLLRWAGIWPRPMIIDTSILEVGASTLAQTIEDLRWQPPVKDTMGLNVRLR